MQEKITQEEITDDILDMNNETRQRRIRKIIYFVLVCYFIAMFIHTINISSRKPPFFTRVLGYDSYAVNVVGSRLSMRIFAVDMEQNTPINNFHAKLTLSLPHNNQEWILFDGTSNGKSYLDIMTNLPQITPGNYLAQLVTTVPNMGNEINEFNLRLTKKPVARTVNVQILDEKHHKKSPAIVAKKLKPALRVYLVPGNGRFVSNLNNNILIIAEDYKTGQAVSEISVSIKSGGEIIADTKTDEMGLASFDYYAHKLGGQRVMVTITDKDGNTHQELSELSPIASQVVAKPFTNMIAQGDNIRFKLEALGKGPWHIDVFHYGNWLFSSLEFTGSAAKIIELSLPKNITGPVQVQVARDFTNPNTAYDAFMVFVYDKKLATLDEDDPKISGHTISKEIMAKFKLEKPFKKLWQYINANSQIEEKTKDRWLRKINGLSLLENGYDPKSLSSQILREIGKDYILLPELINTLQTRRSEFADTKSTDRDNALLVLALSGLVVVIMIGFTLFKEIKQRQAAPELAIGKGDMATMAIFMLIIIAAYAMMLYLLSILDWHKGL